MAIYFEIATTENSLHLTTFKGDFTVDIDSNSNTTNIRTALNNINPSEDFSDLFFHRNADNSFQIATGIEPSVWEE